MKGTIKSITGYEQAIVAMFISKRTWTPELDKEIREVVPRVVDRWGHLYSEADQGDFEKFYMWMNYLVKMGKKHITVLRFLNMSLMTEGMHRAGQDDIDSHARRFDNRIIRSSTRLATFSEGEVSEWYSDKILSDYQVAVKFGFSFPERVEVNGEWYVKSANGYVKEEYKDNKDVKRGLYMLSIPSNFVSDINVCEWAHVYQQRNETGGANPEVKIWAESIMKQLTEFCPWLTRDFIMSVEN